jgi:GT2 family glycosyltransferase
LPSEEDRLSLDLPDGVSYPLVIIQTGGNLGFAGGNNVGIRFAQQRGADYVLLFNNDAVMSSPSGLITLVEFMDCHADVGACGARLLFPDGSPQSSYGRFPSILHTLAILFPLYKLFPDKLFRRFKRSNIIPDASVLEPIPIDYPSGACILVRNKAIEDVGLMDERYFMYAEETDWCYRMMKRGWGRYYVPQMEVLHKFGGSFGTATLKMRRFHLESLFKYFKKHFSEGSLLVLSVGYFLRSLYSIVCWKIIEKFLPKERSRSAIEQAQYWQLAYDQAVRTMKELFFGEASMQIKSKAKQQGIK